ncbi:glucan phosphoethanolaminetransferase (alkaline phosphatase superfamily) [Pedobacter cryoconitis]|uniref:Glucan phosphoethanolaminetransferase (Alkaline phosphatase superfamily) n=1 Tax=Pedobacter cryoconitis TaxID=188932 RepID=A0A7W8ZRX5_9SPHI|nr:glucan phosphoethanolaminetransferase (alkaline phosphatase superfamily) [Pedobacter cryoconitis]
MFRFNKYYFGFTLLLLSIEILIARYAHDQIIRPYAGDFLIVIFLYCLVMSFFNVIFLSYRGFSIFQSYPSFKNG